MSNIIVYLCSQYYPCTECDYVTIVQKSLYLHIQEDHNKGNGFINTQFELLCAEYVTRRFLVLIKLVLHKTIEILKNGFFYVFCQSNVKFIQEHERAMNKRF